MAAIKSLLCSSAILLYLAIVEFHPAGAGFVCGGFVTSCTDIVFGPNDVLTASCKTDSSGGSYVSRTSITLTSVVGNMNGRLTPNTRGFSGTCSDIGVNPNIHDNTILYLKGDCRTKDANYMYSAFDLNMHIRNVNGKLQWQHC